RSGDALDPAPHREIAFNRSGALGGDRDENARQREIGWCRRLDRQKIGARRYSLKKEIRSLSTVDGIRTLRTAGTELEGNHAVDARLVIIEAIAVLILADAPVQGRERRCRADRPHAQTRRNEGQD